MSAASAAAATPAGYSKLQIALHWIVAILIVFQIVGHEFMVEAYDALNDGEVPAALDMLLARGHVIAGIVIWLFALWRVSLRFTRGVPAPVPGGNPLLEKLAAFIHFLLYALLLAMPISGSAAWFLSIEQAAYGHSIARFVLLPAVLLHIAGALAHHFVFKDETMKRMVRPV